MKIRIANNMGDISGEAMIAPEEVGGKMGIGRFAALSKDAIIIATDIFKTYPLIKQITIDTETDEERALIEVVKINIKN